MAAQISVESVGEGNVVYLGETFVPEDPGSLGSGEAVPVVLRNTGTTMLREITVGLEGPSASNIQLAVDNAGEPGQWTDVHGSIICEDTIKPGEALRIWARSCYSAEDAEGRLDGSFVIRAISV